jgi:lipopolysaccharide/colanic/teichoic acid biosynthesis glycosyltransferase
MTGRPDVAAVGHPTRDVRFDPIARLIVFRQTEDVRLGGSLLEYALSAAPLCSIVLDALHRDPRGSDSGFGPTTAGRESATTTWAVPREWATVVPAALGQRINCAAHIDAGALQDAPRQRWFVISDGRFVAHMNSRLLDQALADRSADAVAIMVDPQLAAYRERIRLTPQGRLVGYRRLYQDSIEPILVPAGWPHHLFVSSRIAEMIANEGLPGEFQALVQKLQSRRLGLKALAVAGSLADLGTEDGLLSLSRMILGDEPALRRQPAEPMPHTISPGNHDGVSPQSRFIGPVLLGDHVCVEPGAVIVGPSVLCDNSRICRGAVVDASIIGADAEVGLGQVARSAIVIAHPSPTVRHSTRHESRGWPTRPHADDAFAFRSWGWLSYAGCFKRGADLIAAAVVLILFAPIIPLIALAIKINSPGPVFFRHKRQGLHGKPFYCVKFRTMIAGADTLQEILRFISEVDGPQFKVADDPRITTVGRFLRETFLDEIPQFYNVLMGDMSVVGPRPSPESENTLCPWWRDARLSVRPGITGLWQVCRTRRPLKDFQEWIHYDTEYVRQLSLRLDLWICWRTLLKVIADFIRQF